MLSLSNGFRVRGRVDAIYADDDHWEVVDFKSGRPKDDPARVVQLEAYAVAVNQVDFGGERPEPLHHRDAEGDVGHEVPVHHVDVEPVGAGFERFTRLFLQVGYVGGNNGWR